jgi:hypothetical protein
LVVTEWVEIYPKSKLHMSIISWLRVAVVADLVEVVAEVVVVLLQEAVILLDQVLH